MKNWYVCAIKFDKTLENGVTKKVTEKYLVDALSFTEAEQRIIEEMTPYIVGEFEVRAVSRENISEIFNKEGSDLWFKAKINFISIDEKSGMEKKSKSTVYVNADSLQNAVINIMDGMKNTMSDWELFSITETAIVDMYNYKKESE